jgi:hypothetical protein
MLATNPQCDVKLYAGNDVADLLTRHYHRSGRRRIPRRSNCGLVVRLSSAETRLRRDEWPGCAPRDPILAIIPHGPLTAHPRTEGISMGASKPG